MSSRICHEFLRISFHPNNGQFGISFSHNMDDEYKKIVHKITPPRYIQIKIITCIYATWQSTTNITSKKAGPTYGMSQQYIFHKQMLYSQLSKRVQQKVNFSLEASQARNKSGIQLHSWHITLEKANDVFQHCLACSKLCLTNILSILHL
ncbi:unnamed protein product [Malus baccata var. baccata]